MDSFTLICHACCYDSESMFFVLFIKHVQTHLQETEQRKISSDKREKFTEKWTFCYHSHICVVPNLFDFRLHETQKEKFSRMSTLLSSIEVQKQHEVE